MPTKKTLSNLRITAFITGADLIEMSGCLRQLELADDPYWVADRIQAIEGLAARLPQAISEYHDVTPQPGGETT
jgi:hypothetical protein